MARDERPQHGILGDINPTPRDSSPDEAVAPRDEEGTSSRGQEDLASMHGGSQHDRTKHSGSRDVTEGVTGGTGAETGGTRNYRQGTGATGTDIGNRPE